MDSCGKLLVYPFLFVGLLSAPFFIFAQSSSQPSSTADLQKQIQDLLKQVEILQKQVTTLQAELGKGPETSSTTGAGSTASTAPEVTPPELTRNLSRGSSGDDVRKLQEFLSQDKEIYPEGLLTGFFGPRTEAAVKKWQEKHGIESVGIIGPKTIAKFQDIGKGVIQGLIQQGVESSGITPPGLLQASGIEKKFSTSTPEVPPALTNLTLTGGTTTLIATTTPSGMILATPAVPASPAVPPAATGSTSVVPATPATPAVPAQTTTAPAQPVQPVSTTNTTTTTTTLWAQAVAPASLVIDKGTTLHLNPPGVNYSARFDYTLTSDTKFLRVYLKRPNSADFASYTYDAQLPLLDSSQWNESTASPFLRRTGVSSWYWWPADEFLPNASPTRYGEYKIYVTALNTAGAESAPSEIRSIKIYAPPVISSPVEGSTVSTKPTIAFVTGDSNIGSQYYAAYVYKANNTVVWSNGLAATNFVYPGTELNPSDNPHRLVVHSYTSAPNFSFWYSPFSQVTFSVSASSTAVDTQAPSVPVGLTATAVSSTQVNLSWSASTDNIGVSGYRVYRNGAQIDSPITPYKSDTNLSPSTTYSYTVAAVDGAGNVSAQSSSVSATTPINQIDFAVTSVSASPSSVAVGSPVTVSATFYNPADTAQRIQVTIGKGVSSTNDGTLMSTTYYLSLPPGNTTQTQTFIASYGAISSAPGSPANTYYPEASISGVGNGSIYINPYDPNTANNYLRATTAYTVTSASTTSLLDLRVKNLATISRALESLKIILEQLLKAVH